MFSLESPYRGDSNKYTKYTIFNIKKENHPKTSQICRYGIFPLGLEDELETAMVNEPSVIEPFKFYCIFMLPECNLFWAFRLCKVIKWPERYCKDRKSALGILRSASLSKKPTDRDI